jgi:hypothetical protein
VNTQPKEPDDELREWMADWQGDPEPAPEVRDAIRRRVRRQSFKLALYTAGEMSIGLVMLAFVIHTAVARPVLFNVTAMAGLALAILWAVTYSLWSSRGTWRPSAATTTAFLDLSVLRCRRRLNALRAGWWLLALELAIMIPWLHLLLSSGSPHAPATSSYAAAFGFLLLVASLAVVFLMVARRKALRELRELEELRRCLESEMEDQAKPGV